MHVHHTMQKAGYDIRPEQMMVLGLLWRRDGISQKEICEFTGKSKSNITRTLDKLAKREWVYRQTDPEDRRSFKIFLTDEGKNLKEELFPIMDEILNIAFSDFNREEFIKFHDLLDKITKNLTQLEHLQQNKTDK